MLQAKDTRMDSQGTDALLSDGIGKVNLALQETFNNPNNYGLDLYTVALF